LSRPMVRISLALLLFPLRRTYRPPLTSLRIRLAEGVTGLDLTALDHSSAKVKKMTARLPALDQERSIADRYSRNAEAYRRYWAPVLLNGSRTLLERLPLDRTRRALDLGSGVGMLLPEIRSRIPDGGLVIGADRSEGMLRLAPATFPRAVMDASRLAFRDATFDAVVMAFALFHLNDPVAGLAEIHRVLRPGSTAGVVTWAGDPMESPANEIWNEELDRAGASTEDPWPPRHDLMDTPEKLAGLLSTAGLTEVGTQLLPLEDRMDVEEFLARRTSLGFSKHRFDSLSPEAQATSLRRTRSRLTKLDPEAFVPSEVAILGWGRKAG
jgi:SAM-dependent methyltransferase